MTGIRFTGKTSDFLKIGVAAAARGDLDAVKFILRSRPNWLNRRGSHGRTMLWEAAHRGKLPVAKYLVQRGAMINACGTHYTPYFVEVSCYCIAKFKKHTDVSEFLLAKGAKIGIHDAAYLGDTGRVKKAVRRQPKIIHSGRPQHVMGNNPKDGSDYVERASPWATPLCYALRGGDIQAVDYLLDAGSKVAGHERELFIAANESAEMITRLLAAGADSAYAPRVLPDDGDLYKILKHKKAGRKELSEELVYLCRGDRGGNPEEVRRLISFGAAVNHRDKKGKTALHRAAKAGFHQTVELLVSLGADLEALDEAGESPLFEVIKSTIKSLERIEATFGKLIAAGADPYKLNSRGESVMDLLQSRRDKRSKLLARKLNSS